LSHGARIAVVAPSGPFDRERFELGLAVLRQRYEVTSRADVHAQQGYLAGSDARRASEINDALSDPDVDAIIAARGGYGATRLLPHLDVRPLMRRPKLLVGFSDVTALHAQWRTASVGSLHGTMVAALGAAPPAQRQRMLDALEGRFEPITHNLESLTRGRAEGSLFGGNLAVLCSLLGTPYAPPFAGGVLFLEDVGERPYRVDRMLTSLLLSGQLHQVAAIVLGQFTEAAAGPDGVTVEDVIKERLGTLPCPVVVGLPSGHIQDNLELPFGRRVCVDAQAASVTLLD